MLKDLLFKQLMKKGEKQLAEWERKEAEGTLTEQERQALDTVRALTSSVIEEMRQKQRD